MVECDSLIVDLEDRGCSTVTVVPDQPSVREGDMALIFFAGDGVLDLVGDKRFPFVSAFTVYVILCVWKDPEETESGGRDDTN